jgi:competence protein ComEA
VSQALRALAAAALLLGAGPVLAKKKPLAASERIDLNRASVAELMRLPGLGRSRAEAIAAWREKHPFKSPADVVQVKGVGHAWLEKNRAHLTVSDLAPRPRAPGAPPGAP